MIEITLNGRREQLEKPTTLQALVEQKKLSPTGIAIARNGEIAPKSEWAATLIQTGDTLEIIHAVQGG